MIKKTILILGLISINSYSTLNKSVLLGASTKTLDGGLHRKASLQRIQNTAQRWQF